MQRLDKPLLKKQAKALITALRDDKDADRKPSQRQKAILDACLQKLESKDLTDFYDIQKILAIAVAAVIQREEYSRWTYKTKIGEKLRELLKGDQFSQINYFFFGPEKQVRYRELREFAYMNVYYSSSAPPVVIDHNLLENHFSSENKAHLEEKSVLERHLEIFKPRIEQENKVPEVKEVKLKQNNAKKVLYVSFDFDGCLASFPPFLPENFQDKDPLFKIRYIQKYAKEIAQFIFENNKSELAKIAAMAKEGGYDKLLLNVGSNRQSFYVDFHNAIKGVGSSYPVFDLMLEELQKLLVNEDIEVDLVKRRLADTFWAPPQTPEERRGESGMGEAHGRAQYQLTPRETYDEYHSQSRAGAEWLFDHSKISMIYHQIHDACAKNPDACAKTPGAQIDFHFYDDKYDILKPMHDFFKKNPHLIPENVNLHLHWYENGKPVEVLNPQGIAELHSFSTIKGKVGAKADEYYQDTVVALGALALKGSQHRPDNHDLEKDFNKTKRMVYEAARHKKIGLKGTGSSANSYDETTIEQAIKISQNIHGKKLQPKAENEVKQPQAVSYASTKGHRFEFASGTHRQPSHRHPATVVSKRRQGPST